ncbi:uncharacterized protein LOC144486801 isoform X2 [Mustelus asterias]
MDYIRSHCSCSPEEEVDVSEVNGMVKHLATFPALYASEILTAREVLILVRVERPESREAPNYIPLLRNSSIINPGFLARLPNCEGGHAEFHRHRMKKSKKLQSAMTSSANLGSIQGDSGSPQKSTSSVAARNKHSGNRV